MGAIRFTPTGLVSQWRFGGHPSNNRGTIVDEAGGGNNGTIYGRPALNFNAANEKAAVTTTSAVDPSSTRQFFHYATRLYVDAAAAQRCLVQVTFADTSEWVLIYLSVGDAVLISVKGVGGDTARTLIGPTITEAAWFDLAVEIDSTNNKATIAVDGVEESDDADLSGSISGFAANTPDSIIFGLEADDTNDFAGHMNLIGIGWDDTKWTAADYENFHNFPAAFLADKFGSGDAEYWLCDDGAGAPAGGRSASTLTLTGTDWDVGANGGLTFSAGSMDFDVTDDYINVADADNLSFASGGQDLPFTIACWASPGLTATQQWLMAKYISVGNKREWRMHVNGDETIEFYLRHFDAATRIVATTNSAYADGTLRHFVCTYDGSEAYSGMTIYVDGVARATADNTSGSYTGMTAGTSPLFLGGSADDPASPVSLLDGGMVQAQVYSRELSAIEVKALFDQGAYR